MADCAGTSAEKERLMTLFPDAGDIAVYEFTASGPPPPEQRYHATVQMPNSSQHIGSPGATPEIAGKRLELQLRALATAFTPKR